MLPGAIIPDRKKLAGRILDQEVKLTEDRMKLKIEGRVGTGQCDGWKNKAKKSVVSTMVTVENEAYLINTHDMTKEPKTGDGMFELMKADKKLMEEKYNLTVAGWCADEGPDTKKGKRLMAEEFLWMIILVCWAHQINLVVGDLLGVKHELIEVIKTALEIITWFNGHSAPLAWLQHEQEITYNTSWIIFLPIVTRWLAHYHTCSRLLKIEKALRTCWFRKADEIVLKAGNAEKQARARAVLDPIGDPEFWKKLRRMKELLEPLAIANNVTQARYTRLDHVGLTLANLYRIYSSSTIEAPIHVFILAMHLHPWIRGRCFAKTLSRSGLYNMAENVYKRVFEQEPGWGLLREFMDYSEGLGVYSDESMRLAYWKQRHEESGTPLDLVAIWCFMDNSTNGIARLAIRIFSIIANSGATKCNFSDFGNIQTKKRSRLTVEKTHKINLVRMEIRRRHASQGLL
ncbi:hypothetical protein PILCRDRAFT_80982, partial [Piloderma croceum F 1598]